LTLRARLLIGLVVLAAIGLTVSGVVTYRELRTHLVKQRNAQLRDALKTSPRELFYQFGAPKSGGLPLGTYARLIDPRTGATKATRGYDYPNRPEPRWPDEITVGERFTMHDPHFRGQSISTGEGVVVVAISMDEVDDTLHRLLVVELVVIGVVLGALAILAWWVVRLGLRPLAQMQETAGAIAAGDLSKRIDVPDENTEVGQLGIALNQMLQHIEQAFKEREESEARLRRFVGDASHELRTPLTSIRGYAELFRRGAADRPEDLAKAMRRIEEEADRMGVLVDDLLLLARLDQGRPLERAPVDLTRLAADAVDDARTVAPERSIAFSPNGEVFVRGDEVRLRQVMANLLQNAVRHTPADTPVYVQVTSDENDAVIEVRDEGPGMQTEDANRVFERFWRSDSSRTRASGGTGLGLAIVAAIAEAHGGTATVETAPGEGATFRVQLPRDDWPAPDPAAKADEPAASQPGATASVGDSLAAQPPTSGRAIPITELEETT
jgi:two-component system OmpR family sensor kinase